jgi:hypothetical protein
MMHPRDESARGAACAGPAVKTSLRLELELKQIVIGPALQPRRFRAELRGDNRACARARAHARAIAN